MKILAGHNFLQDFAETHISAEMFSNVCDAKYALLLRKILRDTEIFEWFSDSHGVLTFANSFELFSPLSTKFRALFVYLQKWYQAFSFQPYLYLVPTYPFLLPAPHALWVNRAWYCVYVCIWLNRGFGHSSPPPPTFLAPLPPPKLI